MQITMWPGLAPWMMPSVPAITDCACSVVSTIRMVRSTLAATSFAESATSAFSSAVFDGVDVVHHQRRAGADEIARHGAAHGAQADETDLAGHSFLPWVMVRTVAEEI